MGGIPGGCLSSLSRGLKEVTTAEPFHSACSVNKLLVSGGPRPLQSPPSRNVGFLTAGLSWRARWLPGRRQWRRGRRGWFLGSGWVLAKQLLKGPLLLLDRAGGHQPWSGPGSRGHGRWGGRPWAEERLGRHREHTEAVTQGQVHPREPQEDSRADRPCSGPEGTSPEGVRRHH